MTAFSPGLLALSLRVWPRVAQLGASPSLLLLALLVDGVSALVPTQLRSHKESLS